MEALFGTIKFYTPITKSREHSRVIHNEETGLTYYAVGGIELDDPDYGIDIDEYRVFPFVLNMDGSLWHDATKFLIWKIKQKSDISSERLRQYADALQDFKRFCEMMEEKEVNESEERRFHYLKAPIKTRRPNVMYGRYLKGKNAKQWGAKMKCISAFYKYLIEVRGIRFGVDILETVTIEMIFPTSAGSAFIKSQEINKVDREVKTQNQDDGYIRDGEKMRPMSIQEQEVFEEAILNHTNEELVLGTIIALTTLARKQTVYTLRIKHFINEFPEHGKLEKWWKKVYSIEDNEIKKIKVGYSTGADTKNDKRFFIEIEGWLYKAVINYIFSKRAIERRNKALRQNSDLDQYIFLSRNGIPFYHSKDDINLKAWEDVRGDRNKGNSIDQAMKRFRDEDLAKVCAKYNMKVFAVRFHDLRATGAMRYLDRNEYLVNEGKAWGAILRKLANKMAHESLVTTQRYLDFKLRVKEELPKLQFEFEKNRMAAILTRTRYKN